MRLPGKHLLAVVILLAGAGTGTGVAIATAPEASAQQVVNICWNHHCQNLWNNNRSFAAPVKFYHAGGNNLENKWQLVEIGTVNGQNCTTNCWPFAPGSGLNTRYHNNIVWQFQYYNDPRWCQDQSNYNVTSDSGQLQIQRCNSASSRQWFVQSSLDYLIPVFATNLRFIDTGVPNNPLFVGNHSGNVSDGAQIYMGTAATIGQLQWFFQAPT
jgi:hypothetical protein